MMKNICFTILTTALSLQYVQATKFQQTEPCRLEEIAELHPHGEPLVSWFCVLGQADAESAGVGKVQIEGMDKLIETGYHIVPHQSTFFSPTATINDGVLSVPSDSSSYDFDSGMGESLIAKSIGAGDRAYGQRSFLVVTVNTLDGNAGADPATMRNSIFGNGLSLAGQISQCSYGKMTIEEATGPGINGGVYELSLNRNSNGVSSGQMYNDADLAVSAVFGDLEQRFDFVMYCFPDNVDFGGAGTYPLPLLFGKALLKMLTHVVILLYLQLLGLL